MTESKTSISEKVGRPPGELKYIGSHKIDKAVIVYRNYSATEYNERSLSVNDEIKIEQDKVNWLQCAGLSDVEVIRKLSSEVRAHSMLVEDILNTNHLPKYDSSENYIAVLLKAFTYDENGVLEKNSVCIVLSDNTVLDVHDIPNSYFEQKIERIKQGKGRARNKGADYLFYVLLDGYIDTYYLKFDEIRERIVELEEQLLKVMSENKIEDIHNIKSELTELRKVIFPLKESIQLLLKDDSDLISENNKVFFNDIKDHMNQFAEYYTNYNEMVKSLLDLNNSNLNNNINQVMKVLTIIATIFIPLTFIAGVYGMNFEYMPELKSPYGYFATIAVMIVISIGMIVFMKRKKWF